MSASPVPPGREKIEQMLEWLRMEGKPPVAEWEGGKTYDTEQDEGYDQAVSEINAKIDELKGEEND